MILNIVIRWMVINWVLIWKGLLFYLTKFCILLTHRLSSWTKMWVLGLHHSLLNRLCVPINCLFTSNTQVQYMYILRDCAAEPRVNFTLNMGLHSCLTYSNSSSPSLSKIVHNQFFYYTSYSHSMTSHLSRPTEWLNDFFFSVINDKLQAWSLGSKY